MEWESQGFKQLNNQQVETEQASDKQGRSSPLKMRKVDLAFSPNICRIRKAALEGIIFTFTHRSPIAAFP
jgi:hypothetical protein